MFTVDINKKMYEFADPISLESIIRDSYRKYAVAAYVDGKLTELNGIIDHDCTIEPVELDNEDGVRVYFRTLKFVFIMAVNKLYPNAKVKFLYGISRGQYCEINGVLLNTDKIRRIEDEMRFLIKQNLPFEKFTVKKDEAQKIFLDMNYLDKSELLFYRPEDDVALYRCGKFINYLYGYMMPSTGYLRSFKLHYHSPGLVIMYPRHELGGIVPDFEQSVKFDRTLWKAEQWGRITKVTNIAQLNGLIKSNNAVDLINMCEIRHENEIEYITENIASDIKNNKVILIAGPSSSGKTTLSHRLQAHLAVHGIRALPISTDNYYLERSDIKPDIDGKVDLEHINAIDLKRFNNDLIDLINGKEVALPTFDFGSGKSFDGKTIKISNDECLIVEGIHGLNEILTSSVPRYNKYKIYISALSHINIDDHTPISTTTCRLIRRTVRDSKFRNSSIHETLSMWDSVRKGEFRWIYPYQEDVDYIFNSELTYELAVLKKYIMPLITDIDKDDPDYIKTNKISNIIKYVESIDDDLVPSTSILREFIGGSNYS